MQDGRFENFESNKIGMSQTIQSGSARRSARSINAHNNHDIEHLNDYQRYQRDSLGYQ